MSIKSIDIDRAIKDIQKLNIDLGKLNRRATPDTVGFYGELLAYKLLNKHFGKRGYEIDFGSGQSKADIVISKNKKRINIEVKTSRLKEEWYGLGYGVAINVKKCKLHPGITFEHFKKGKILGDFCYFDYLILITISSDDLKKFEFYIIPRSFIEKNQNMIRNKNKRFTSASHRIILLVNKNQSYEITKFDNYFLKKKKDFKDAWHLIK